MRDNSCHERQQLSCEITVVMQDKNCHARQQLSCEATVIMRGNICHARSDRGHSKYIRDGPANLQDIWRDPGNPKYGRQGDSQCDRNDQPTFKISGMFQATVKMSGMIQAKGRMQE